MANEITGREVIIALKKAAVWHTPVVCGAGDGLLILSDGIKVAVPAELDDSAGQEWITQADAGVKDIKGSIDAYMRYEGFDVALAMIMGIAGAPTLAGAALAYSNTYGMASNITGMFATMAQQKLGNKVWEFPSLKLHGFKLSGQMNKPLKLTLDGIADRLDRASVTNDTTSMAAVTMPDVENRILMNKDTVVRINDQSGAALGSGDAVYPSAIDIAFNRPMDAEPVAGQDGVDEPADNGFPTVSVSLKFPRYNTANDAYFDDLDAFTSKKMDITFTGKLIETGQNYMFKLSFPHVKIDTPEAPVSGAGKIPFSMNCKVLGATAAPAGMTHITPMQIDVVNKRTIDPLA